ncbi:type III-B CRISPR module-associated protein Cmr5 [Candidatus Methylocalor cossyra]|uniref:CRISPR type III-B/RAMP module-associated protein Cmr5 n=1 Tax=Candidatus Methylocalor cossyra TaxID=3108543 RepID=A0ABM9NK90_9GAMM
MPTRSQRYAAAIYERVRDVQNLPRKQQKQYGALCHRFPSIVLENGLAAALGFLAAKGREDDSPPRRLLNDYGQVLGRANLHLHVIRTTTSLAEYRRLTQEILTAAEWFKRYAEAILKVDPTDDGSGNSEEETENA